MTTKQLINKADMVWVPVMGKDGCYNIRISKKEARLLAQEAKDDIRFAPFYYNNDSSFDLYIERAD